MITLDIISDPICPWCYIGKAKLDRALEAHADHPFDIHWRPFQLNPDMPPEGMDRHEYLSAKFGPDNAARFYAQIEQAATDAGLDVDFSAIARTPNTIDAHRLIRWSRTTGNQSAVINQLFRRYFKQGQDISDRAVLTEVANSAGMDADVVGRLLQGSSDSDEVRSEDALAREMGVQGVPTFIVANEHVLTGAQETDLWNRVLDEMLSNPHVSSEQEKV